MTPRERLSRILRNRVLLIAVGLLAAYSACGFLLAPYLVKRLVPEYARDTLKREASIGEVRVNPFLLTFEARDFRLAEADGRPIVSARRVYLDLEAASLFHWAWDFADIAVDGLDLHVVTRHDGSVNLLDLAAAMKAGSRQAPAGGKADDPPPAGGKEDDPPPRLLLQHVALTGARLTYTDLTGASPASTTLAPIDLKLEDLSTLSEHEGSYAIRAKLPAGGTVSWRGKLSLLAVASDGELSISRLRPASYWGFLHGRLRLDPPQGAVDFSTRYRFTLSGAKPQLLLRDAALKVTGLSVRQPGAEKPLVALDSIEASGIGLDWQRRSLSVPKLEVRKGLVSASVAPDETVDWETISKSTSAPRAPSTAAEPWRISFGAIKVADVGLRYSDSSRATPLSFDVGKVAISADAQVRTGGATVAVSSDRLHVELSQIAVTRIADEARLVSLDDVTLDAKSIDTAKREIDLREIAVRGGSASLTRGANGKIDLIEAFTPAERGKLGVAAARAQEAAKAEGAPWRLQLDALELSQLRLSLADRSFEPAVQYDLADVSAKFKGLSSDLHAPVDFESALRAAQGGQLSVSGSLDPDGSGADLRMKLSGLDLVPLQPVVARYATLALKSGNLSAGGTLQYRETSSGPNVRANGSVQVAGLLIDNSESGARFLAWKSLLAEGVEFSLKPDRLAIAQVRVVQPAAKITVFKDHSVNLARVLKMQGGGSKAGGGSRFPITVERVRVQGGTVDYADHSLVLPFAAHVTHIAGSATGLSSDPASRADVQLHGRVEQNGLARVSGAISPFAPKRFTDLRTEFRNVAMKPLSPYSATFAGRKIASGSLDLNLEYKIENGKLKGENKVLLDHFTLGERVESPSAIHLPLDLAIALLTDSQGRINVAVPVSGDVDNPHFSYGKLIGQAIFNAIEKIITAPFRALGALLGGGGGEGQLNAISFDPGSSHVLPPELDKLKKVSEALAKRPQLKVVVEGTYDASADGEALRARKLRREVATALGAKLAPNERAGPVAVDSAKTQLELEKLLTKRSGKEAMADFQAQYEKRTGRKVSRVSPALAFFGKGSTDHDFYQALHKKLIELQPLGDAELRELAKRRAAAVEKALVEKAKVDPARVATGKIAVIGETKAGGVDTKLSLEVLKATPPPKPAGSDVKSREPEH